MKLLWVVKNFPPSMGGVQQYTFHYVLNMHPGSCVVLTRRLGDMQGSKNVDEQLTLKHQVIYRIPVVPEDLGVFSLVKHPFLFFSFCLTLLKIIKKENITHVIFAHPSFYYFFSMLPVKGITRIPFLCIFHGEDIPSVYLRSNGLMRWFINRLDACTCNSLFTHNRLQEFLGRKLPELIAYPGVEEKFFQPLDQKKCKQQFGVSDRKVIYTVGRLDERKGHDLVIQAMPEIIEKVPDVIYLIGGKGPYFERLQSLVQELQVEEYVKFCGFIAEGDVCTFHHGGDVFVMPNRILADGDTEGFGIVFLEAAAAGKPVIAGKAGGAVDAVVDGETGFLVDPYGKDEFIAKTVLLLTSPDSADVFGARGRERAGTSFRWPLLADNLSKQLAGI